MLFLSVFIPSLFVLTFLIIDAKTFRNIQEFEDSIA